MAPARPTDAQALYPARQTEAAVRLLSVLAPSNDVYVGVALRDERGHGVRAAVSALDRLCTSTVTRAARRELRPSHTARAC